MTVYFFDTSALVKRYYDEPGSQQVDAIVDDDTNDVIVSTLLIVETVSAFRRKHNRGEISAVEMEQSVGVFFREALDEFVVVPLQESFVTFSFDLVLEGDLRTLDSLQLSAGLSIDRELEGTTFVTADHDLARIGEQRGLSTEVPG